THIHCTWPPLSHWFQQKHTLFIRFAFCQEGTFLLHHSTASSTAWHCCFSLCLCGCVCVCVCVCLGGVVWVCGVVCVCCGVCGCGCVCCVVVFLCLCVCDKGPSLRTHRTCSKCIQ